MYIIFVIHCAVEAKPRLERAISPKEHNKIRILQTMVSEITLVLGPCVDVVFGAGNSWGPLYSTCDQQGVLWYKPEAATDENGSRAGSP